MDTFQPGSLINTAQAAMHFQPAISVIVAAKDEEKCIARTLQSVRDQRYPVELIVVSNGSTDRTARISSGYADRVIELAEPSIPASKNAGYREASGSIVAFLDADSPMRPGLVGETVRLVNSGYAGGKARIHPETQNVAGHLLFWYANLSNKLAMEWGNTHPGSPQSGSGAYIFCTRKAAEGILKSYGSLFDEGLATMEDVDFTKRMAEQGSLAFAEGGVSTSVRRYVKGRGHYLGVFLRDDCLAYLNPEGKRRQWHR